LIPNLKKWRCTLLGLRYPNAFIPLLTPMSCHLPSQFFPFCVNGVSLVCTFNFFLLPPVCESAVLRFTSSEQGYRMVPWVNQFTNISSTFVNNIEGKLCGNSPKWLLQTWNIDSPCFLWLNWLQAALLGKLAVCFTCQYCFLVGMVYRASVLKCAQ